MRPSSLAGAMPEHAVLFYPGSFIDAADGSQVRTLGLLDWLCRHFRKVTLYSFDGGEGAAWTPARRKALEKAYPGVRLVTERKGALLSFAARAKRMGLIVAPALSRHLLKLRIARLTPEFDRLTTGDAPMIFVNYLDNLVQLNGVRPDRCVVETHDVQFFRRSKGAGRSPLSLASLVRLRSEFAALGAVAAAVGISRNETYLLRNMAPQTPIFYVPEYAPLPCSPAQDNAKNWDLLFVGSHNVINERGLVELFGRRDLGLERYSIAICGSICRLPSIKAIAAGHENVQLLGFVDDLASVYARSAACLSPTRGTGLNIKILEALRYGRPVFATKNAMDGLTEGYENCVLPIKAEQFARILGDRQSWQAASKAASDYYLHFTRGGDLAELSALVRGNGASEGDGPPQHSFSIAQP